MEEYYAFISYIIGILVGTYIGWVVTSQKDAPEEYHIHIHIIPEEQEEEEENFAVRGH